MNKEEIEKAFKKLIHCSDNNDIHHSVPISLRECNLLMNEFNRLQQENKELKERIDKAIEYIENNIDNTGWLEIGTGDVKYLLEILKGE